METSRYFRQRWHPLRAARDSLARSRIASTTVTKAPRVMLSTPTNEARASNNVMTIDLILNRCVFMAAHTGHRRSDGPDRDVHHPGLLPSHIGNTVLWKRGIFILVYRPHFLGRDRAAISFDMPMKILSLDRN